MTEGLAAGEGFEPSQTESESGVLPLHKPAKRKSYYTRIKQIVKAFFKYFHKKILKVTKMIRPAPIEPVGILIEIRLLLQQASPEANPCRQQSGTQCRKQHSRRMR